MENLPKWPWLVLFGFCALVCFVMEAVLMGVWVIPCLRAGFPVPAMALRQAIDHNFSNKATRVPIQPRAQPFL